MLKIKAPCSSANVGPGFDCLGIAFDIYNIFKFEPSEKNEYVGFADKYCNDNNLVYKSYKTATESIGAQLQPLRISFQGDVPTARGLGSSSTCIAAGVTAAYELSGKSYTKNDVAYIASLIEGHPDNVAACVYGGFTSSLLTADDQKEKLIVENFAIDDGFFFYALIPDFELTTKQSREVLPKTVALTTAKKNLANMPLLIKAFADGNEELLKFAGEDWLHQPYRGGIIEGYFDIKAKAEKAGAAAVFLSGAGPTMLVVSKKDLQADLEDIVAQQKELWQVKNLKVDFEGLTLKR